MLVDDNYCFGCGANNPIGLRLKFEHNQLTGEYSTVYVPAIEHQGWVGRVHGGLLALVFDEVLSRVALTTLGMHWVTAELTTRMILPAMIGEPLLVRARIDSHRSRIALTSAVAEYLDGRVVAKASAKLMKPRSEDESGASFA
jgi:acyl-coenzyme A thioesterase PaaI-like protein